MPQAGERRPYRPIPAGFAELFARLGWAEIGLELHAHQRTIRRWIAQSGEARLHAMRRDFLAARYAAAGRRVPGARPGRRPSRQISQGA